jgi:Flp pilus assembly protein TadB
MNSTTTLPGSALQELERHIQSANSLRRYITDYSAVIAVTLCYAYIAWLDVSSNRIHFLGLLVIILMIHSVSEQRAQHRLKLLLEALEEIQRFVKA